MATNLIANDTSNFLLRETCISGNVRFLEWFKFLSGSFESLISSFGLEIQVTTVVVESSQR